MRLLFLMLLIGFGWLSHAQIDCTPGHMTLASALPNAELSTSDRLLVCRQEAGTNALYYSPDINNAELIGFLEANPDNSDLEETIQALRNQSAQEYTRALQQQVLRGEMISRFYTEDASKRSAYTEFTTLYNRGNGGAIPARPGNAEGVPTESESESGSEVAEEEQTQTDPEEADDDTAENENSEVDDPTEAEELPPLENPEDILDALIAAGPENTEKLNHARTACSNGDEQEVQLKSFKGLWAEGTGEASILPLSYEPIVESGANRIGTLRYYKDAVIINGQVIQDAGIKERKVSLINGVFTVETPPTDGASRSWQVEFARSTTEEVAKANPTTGEQIQSASCYLAEKIPAATPPETPAAAPSANDPPASEVSQ